MEHHTILDNVKYGIRKIREAVGEHCKIIYVRINTNILKYVLKYVKKAIVLNVSRDGTKSFTNDTKKFVHASLYWITGCHMISMSKSLQKEINKDNNKDKKDNEKKKREGEYVATVPTVVREPYPEMTVQIQLSLYYWNPCML